MVTLYMHSDLYLTKPGPKVKAQAWEPLEEIEEMSRHGFQWRETSLVKVYHLLAAGH